ncbi:hypothetical protein Poly51_63330 [Rubripirellula tenax]|uniref:Uncharacterized protein n=1 Tax=Rubripirellula tenax TaxID=2528015 RepID=A0A5C6E1P7_9BACT|nr:hypothetical protein Poly51_63330 [Rubripirellula tenax]
MMLARAAVPALFSARADLARLVLVTFRRCFALQWTNTQSMPAIIADNHCMHTERRWNGFLTSCTSLSPPGDADVIGLTSQVFHAFARTSDCCNA